MEVINYLKRVNGSGHIVEHIGWHESGDYLLRQLFEPSDKGYRHHKYEVEKEYKVIDKAEVDALDKQTCGRRMNDFGAFTRAENLDFWKKEGDFRTCSFCGSIHPMDLIEEIKKKGFGIIGRTDKQYKWYINNTKKYYRQHDTKEFIDSYNKLLDASRPK